MRFIGADLDDCAAQPRRDQFGLGAQLRGVVEMLPVASATAREKGAGRLAPIRPRRDHAFDLCDRKIFPARRNRDFEAIAGRGIRDHHGSPIHARDRIGPERHRMHFDFRHLKGASYNLVYSSADNRG